MSANILIKSLVVMLGLIPPTGLPALLRAAETPNTAYVKQKVLGVRVHMVVVDMNDPSFEVGVALSRGGLGRSESFGSMLNRTHPVAAITGTFFCTRSLKPIGDIVIDGRRINRGPIGACLAFGPDNKLQVRPAKRGVDADWNGFVTGLRSGPKLISGGKISINAKSEGFHEKGLFARRQRSAIGMTANNKLLLVLVRTPVTFSELAKVMRKLGAVEAINLDGGSSSALSYGGKIVVYPQRRLTNVIVINRRQPIAAKPKIPLPATTSSPSVPLGISVAPPAPLPEGPQAVAGVTEQIPVLPKKTTGEVEDSTAG